MLEMICITCPKGCNLKVEMQEGKILAIYGNSCPRGKVYAENEIYHPTRMLTSTVQIKKASIARCPIMTSVPIPKEKMMDVMKEIEKICVEAPIACREVLVKNICGLEADLIATRSFDKVCD